MNSNYFKGLLLLLLFPLGVWAQQGVLTGLVLDGKTKQPLPGVNVVVQGTSSGVSTDLDGKFKIGRLKAGDKIVFDYIGYKKEYLTYKNQTNVTITLEEEANQLQEVVVQVGYGSSKKRDLTGAVSVVSSKDFNRGAITSADQLLIGKAPGVRITTDGGAPDSAPNIRIRGGASLSGENSPLVVIDNVPVDNQNAAGNGNLFSLINPNDIETFTILKDASATAIYGARASNGVILITTKKGASTQPQFTYSSVFSTSVVSKYVNVMDGPTFANFVNSRYPSYSRLLGAADDVNDPNNSTRTIYNTNWQDAIYRQTFNQDHNFSVRGMIFGNVPMRASVGYNATQGVVRNNDYSRISGSLKINPSFFNNHLKFDINAKGLTSKKNNIDAGGAIGSAISMDPTKPIYGPSPDNRFVGYYQETYLNGNQYKLSGATNPVATLEQAYNPETVAKFIGNIETEYKFHFLPEMRAVLNLGLETSQSQIQTFMADNSIGSYGFIRNNPTIANDPHANYIFNPGLSRFERQTIVNRTLDFYLQYNKKMTGWISNFDTQAGYTYQSFINDGYKYSYSTQYNPNGNTNNIYDDVRFRVYQPTDKYYGKMVWLGFISRTKIDFFNKYLLTITMRADASSLFTPEKRWGYFPSVGLAWRMKDEAFIKNINSINDMKLRLGFGITGNSDIRPVAGYYPYIPLFQLANSTSQYLTGVNSYNQIPFNLNNVWETTTTYNLGVDFDLFKNSFITGSIDVYSRETSKLFAKVPTFSGQYLTNESVINIGTLTNKGVELNLVVKPVATKNVTWTVNGNISYNYSQVKDLGAAPKQQAGAYIPNGTGTPLSYHTVGEQPNSAWVYQQVYDTNGKPIPNVFVDRNGDGVINELDKYFVPMRPNWVFGFGTTFTYKQFDLTSSFRGQFGGKVYNAMQMNLANEQHAIPTQGNALSNILNQEILFVNTINNVSQSDYFLEDATFLRCESLSLGYRFEKLAKNSSMRVSVGVNNLFLITKYSGPDPENFNGVDQNFYPRPRVWNMGCTIDF